LKRLELSGFKSFAKKTAFDFSTPIVAIVGPNGSGKSNVAESIRFVLGEQSMKSMRGKRGEDLIWSGSSAIPRANRASVALTFDNSSRFLDIDFDEVVVERVVHRDGVNEYLLNGSAVRLKDILGLLAGANIGQSGHHIISQGEADKILSANPKERREMLEDALGLKVYQYKKEEASRKLEKTEENMRQVEALRREVAPHLKFLKRQVDKIQKSEDLRVEAQTRFKEYFAHEEAYLKSTGAALGKEKASLGGLLAEVRKKIQKARETLTSAADSVHSGKIVALSEEIDAVREKRSAAARDAARLSGQLDALVATARDASISSRALTELIDEHERMLPDSAGSLESALGFVRGLLSRLRALLSEGGGDSGSIDAIKKKKAEAEDLERNVGEKEAALSRELETLRKELDEARSEEREKERELFALSTEERELLHAQKNVEERLTRVKLEEDEFKRESGEAAVLIGREAVTYVAVAPDEVRSRAAQEAEKKELQKIKIRLEEMGATAGEDILKEYTDATEREKFLEQELHDLNESGASLKQLVADLDAELSARFEKGMKLINDEFTRFFSLMFDGGSAKLVFVTEVPRRIRTLLDEDDDGIPDELEKPIEGIDLSLSIPRKRIKSLTMLSGGERALTSIALIFAMSSVNPPPFVVLDETDAALDEANSKRYGDMVDALSKKSQLVLITHNRETMSRAGVLYGVTMGGDGVSKVLSVKLEEAVQVAK